MSRYRKIEVRTWSDEKFNNLSPMQPSGRGLWFFLLTGPHTGPIPGLFRAGRAAMAEELEWSTEGFAEAFQEVSAQGMAKADWKARLVWLPKAIKHNPPENPNVVKSWAQEVDLLPECELKREALASIRAYLETRGEAFVAALFGSEPAVPKKPSGKPSAKGSAKGSGNPSGNGMANQEQEQEQDKSRESTDVDSSEASSGESNDTTTPHPHERVCQLVLEAYHEILPRCARIEVLSPKRRKRILTANKLAAQLCREQGWSMTTRQFWTSYFEECSDDAWMRGDVPNPKNPRWRQNLFVLIDEERFAGLMDRAIERVRGEPGEDAA